MVTPLVAACNCPTFAASVSSVPIPKPLIFLLFKLAPPFKAAAPVTTNEPALTAPVVITEVNVGAVERFKTTLLPVLVAVRLASLEVTL